MINLNEVGHGGGRIPIPTRPSGTPPLPEEDLLISYCLYLQSSEEN